MADRCYHSTKLILGVAQFRFDLGDIPLTVTVPQEDALRLSSDTLSALRDLPRPPLTQKMSGIRRVPPRPVAPSASDTTKKPRRSNMPISPAFQMYPENAAVAGLAAVGRQ